MVRGADLCSSGMAAGFRLARPASSRRCPAAGSRLAGLPAADWSRVTGSAELSAAVSPARPARPEPATDCDSSRSDELPSGVAPPRGDGLPVADDPPRPAESPAGVSSPRLGESAGLADVGSVPPGESAERPAGSVLRRRDESAGLSAGSDFARSASRRARARAAALRSARLGRRGPAGRPGVSGAESPSEGSGVGGVIARDASKDRPRRGDSRAASTRPERTSR